MTQLQVLTARLVLLAMVLAYPCVSFAQLNVIVSGGFRAAYQRATPEYERVNGIKLVTTYGASQGNSATAIIPMIHRGVAADVVIMGLEGLEELIAEGKIVAGTEVNLAETPTGVGVRTGAPLPDIGTVESFKRTLLQAKSVAFPSSTTGIFVVNKLFPRLGIAEEMKSKSSTLGAVAVARGEVEIAIRPESEIRGVEGVTYVGPIPADVQFLSIFSGAVVKGAKDVEGAKRLLAYLASEKTEPAIRSAGMVKSKH